MPGGQTLCEQCSILRGELQGMTGFIDFPMFADVQSWRSTVDISSMQLAHFPQTLKTNLWQGHWMLSSNASNALAGHGMLSHHQAMLDVVVILVPGGLADCFVTGWRGRRAAELGTQGFCKSWFRGSIWLRGSFGLLVCLQILLGFLIVIYELKIFYFTLYASLFIEKKKGFDPGAFPWENFWDLKPFFVRGRINKVSPGGPEAMQATAAVLRSVQRLQEIVAGCSFGGLFVADRW